MLLLILDDLYSELPFGVRAGFDGIVDYISERESAYDLKIGNSICAYDLVDGNPGLVQQA